jgi:hypothetical protein
VDISALFSRSEKATFFALNVTGTALAAGAWADDRHAKMRSVLRCIEIVGREEPVASAIPLTFVGSERSV